MMFKTECDARAAGGKKIAIPIGKQDATVFRKVMSAKDAI